MTEQVYAAEGKIVRVAPTQDGKHAIVGIETTAAGRTMAQTIAMPQPDLNSAIAMLSSASGECLARRSGDPASIHVLPVAQWAAGHAQDPSLLIFRFVLTGGATLHLGLPAEATEQLIMAIQTAAAQARGKPA